MEQLYFTACRRGHSVTGESGFQIRAVSNGLAARARTAAADAARYTLGAFPPDVPLTRTPRRLALVDVPGAGRVLCHTTYLGRDSETGRDGNFFSHVLVGTAAELDPLWAIQSWGSRFWKTADDDGPVELPSVARQAVTPGPLTAELLPEIGQRHRAEVEFLLHGLLGCPANQKLFLMALPEVAARSLFAALSGLPPKLRTTMTFSTYEPEPLAGWTRVVVTTCDPSMAREMDAPCFTTHGWGLNPSTGNKSNLPAAPAWVPKVLASFAQSQATEQLVQRFGALEFADGSEFLRYTDLVLRQRTLTDDEIKQPMSLGLVEMLLEMQPDLANRVLTAAIVDASFRLNSLPTYLKALSSKPRLTAEWLNSLWQRGVALALAGNLDAAKMFWELPVPAGATLNIGMRFVQCPEAPQFPENVRLYALPKVAPLLEQNPDQQAVWLTAPVTNMAPYLACLTDAKHKASLVRQSLRAAGSKPSEGLPAAAVVLLSNQRDFAFELLHEHGTASPVFAGTLLRQLIKEGPNTDWLTLLPKQPWPPPLLDACLSAALEAQQGSDLAAWLKTYATLVQTKLETGTTPAVLAGQILERHATQWTRQPEFFRYLDWVAAQRSVLSRLTTSQRAQLSSQFGINQFCEQPSLEPEKLQRVAAALRELPTAATATGGPRWWRRFGPTDIAVHAVEQENVLKATTAGLLGNGTTATLETVLRHLGPAFATDHDWTVLFELLWVRCSRQPEFLTTPNLLTAFVAVAFGESADPKRPLQIPKTHDRIAERSRFARDLYRYCRDQQQTPAWETLLAAIRTWRPGAQQQASRFLTQQARATWTDFTRETLHMLTACVLMIVLVFVLYLLVVPSEP